MTLTHGETPDSQDGTRASVERLNELLNMLYGRPENPDLITLDDVLRRYRLTALGKPAMTAIDQSRRMVRAVGDYEQIGLCEFHIGLIFLYWGDGRGAAQQFMAARQQWSFTDHTAAVTLAHYAAGVAQRRVFEHEKAARQLGKVKQLLPRIPLAPVSVTNQFMETLQAAVETTRSEMRDEMWPPPLMGGETEIAPPQSRLGVSEPAFLPNLQPSGGNGRLLWFRVIQPVHFPGTKIEEGDWLLVQSTPPDHAFSQKELIVIVSDVMIDAGVRLTPQESAAADGSFFLAQAQFTGRLDKQTAVPVQLTAAEATELAVTAIIGPLAGIWRPIKS